MDTLPYFLVLVKKNIILCTFITSGTLSGIDFKGYETDVWSDALIEIKGFKLSNEDAFSSVKIWLQILDCILILALAVQNISIIPKSILVETFQ